MEINEYTRTLEILDKNIKETEELFEIWSDKYGKKKLPGVERNREQLFSSINMKYLEKLHSKIEVLIDLRRQISGEVGE